MRFEAGYEFENEKFWASVELPQGSSLHPSVLSEIITTLMDAVSDNSTEPIPNLSSRVAEISQNGAE